MANITNQNTAKPLWLFIIFIFIGVMIGAGLMTFLNENSSGINKELASESQKPLYWVAPMDANYRRDKPGKSPMGMDLIPVYENADSSQTVSEGAVFIAPHVINNLGVRTAPVQLKSMATTLTTVGYVQYNEDNLVHIHPRVEGWIDTLYVKAAGNSVNKDEAIYTLYSPQLVNAQEEFLIALKRNNTSLIQAAKERMQALQLSSDFIKNLMLTKTVKQTVTFNAPQSGVVDGLNVREGFYVKPGTTIMSIGQLQQVWVEAEVFERDAALVENGLPVSMTLDYLPGRLWSGVVDYVYPTLDAKTRTIRVRLKFNNDDLALKPNMFAQVSIHANTIENTLVVPRESVIRTGKQDRVVLALGNGEFKSIAVKIGRVDDISIEILDGLKNDDEVVVSAQFLIDSESSKNSDFKRMSVDNSLDEPAKKVSRATVNGVVNNIDVKNRMVNISREAIEKWNRPAATVDFFVDNAVDISTLTPSMLVTFSFEVRDELVIVAIEPVASANAHSGH